MPTPQEEIEKLAALALASLVEVAWADGRITEGERRGVIEASKSMGLDRDGDFCRTTLRRWLHEVPPTEALEEWRRLLAPALEMSQARAARRIESQLLNEARRIAKMDERPFEPGASLDAGAGITEEEQHVLDDLAEVLSRLANVD